MPKLTRFKEFVIHDVDTKCMCGDTMHGAVARSTDHTVTITGEKEDVERVVSALATLGAKERGQ